MKLYKITRLEYSGYDCTGHFVEHLVYANSEAEAKLLIPDENDYDPNGWKISEFQLPGVRKKRKGFIIF
jgi:hypothetical protein